VLISGSFLVESGLIVSESHLGRDVTGVRLASDQCAAYPELLLAAAPGVTRIGALWNATEPASELHLAELQRAASGMGLTVIPLDVPNDHGTLRALSLGQQQGIDAVVVVPGGFMDGWSWYIHDLLVQRHLPSVFPWSDRAASGALIAAGPSLPNMCRGAAGMVVKILRGAHPAEVPIQTADAELAINLSTAHALGLTLPQTLLARATEIVQ
jgi:putative ABC transport system substrate-binding protein